MNECEEMSSLQGDEKSVHYYRLKVNINGFKIDDIKVTLEDISRSNGKENPKARVNRFFLMFISKCY